MQPNAPNKAIMSPKKGSIAGNVVAMITDSDREINRRTTLRIENSSFLVSENRFSSTIFVGCK